MLLREAFGEFMRFLPWMMLACQKRTSPGWAWNPRTSNAPFLARASTLVPDMSLTACARAWMLARDGRLRTPAVIEQKLNYIHMNPVKEGLVAEAHHYLYSSAASYAGIPALLEVELI